MSFPPSQHVSGAAHIKSREDYDALYEQSLTDPDRFWSDAAEQFHWNKRWTLPVSRYNFDSKAGRVFAEWFPNGETNLCYNSLDRHVESGHGDRVAFYWEGNSPQHAAVVSYSQVLEAVCRLANFLKSVEIGRASCRERV